MLFTSQTGLDISSLFENEYIDQYALQESVNNCEMELRMFEYDYNHEYHDVEMVAIEAYKDHNDDMALLESQFEVITEGFLGKIWEKFKSFLKMIWNGIVKLVTKLLEFLHLKKKKLEEEQQKADEEEKEVEQKDESSSKTQTSTNTSSSQQSGGATNTSSNKNTEAPKASSTASVDNKPSEAPKNMNQAIQKQEEKKQKEGYFSQNKKPAASRKDDRSWNPKGKKAGHGTRKIPVNKVVIQNSYVDISKAIDVVSDVQLDILNFFKSVSNIIKDLLSGKASNSYLERVISPKYTNSNHGKAESNGQYISPEGNMSYDEILNATIKPKYVRLMGRENSKEENAGYYGLTLLVGDSYDSKNASISIKRTIENERGLRNKFITITGKVINKNKLSEIKKSCDDVEKAINNITDTSEVGKANTSINKLAYNGFRRAYMSQLQLVRGVNEVISLSERGEREALKSHDTGKAA